MADKEINNKSLFLRNDFKGKGIFDIPIIKKDSVSLKDLSLVGYDKLSDNDYDKIVHFFLDDYKFEVLWNNPEPRMERLSKYKAVLSPQFSLYKEMPMSLKIFNTFKNRWCGAYFQKKGIKVIPSLAWGESDTFWFCFDGIEKGSIVAVSTLGVRKEKELFMQGYNEMLRKIQPSAIICYGKPFEEMQGKIIEVDYSKTNNCSKGYEINKTYIFDDYIEEGMGGAAAPRIPSVYLSDLPSNVQRAYYGYESVNWLGNFPGQTPGTRAYGIYENREKIFPDYDDNGNFIEYRKYDINNKVWIENRDNERFIRGSNGRVYYSSSHYVSFVEVIGG